MASCKNEKSQYSNRSDEDSDQCQSNSRREIMKFQRKLALLEEEIKQLKSENRQLLQLISPPPVAIPEPPAYSSNPASYVL